ncbi:MAG: hypothetical protein FD123_2070 [Bacteroidetes bacterium]|nr:MAG: hypothetical protein FD123_2070 [Bacteroidota bacterium]
MKNIRPLDLEKYHDSTHYKLIEEGIYLDLNDSEGTNHRFPVSAELEDGEDGQYPIEDILDKFYLHVSDFLESENRSQNQLKLELAGELEDIRQAKIILGKRVCNREFIKDGKTYVDLIIE